jgi:nitrate/nitrite transporter NarK
VVLERADPSAESAAREEATSLRILLWTFALAAIAMCLTVVLTLARTWSELLWVSAFVLVFALLKIALANALFYVMIHYDKEAPRPARDTAILQPPRRASSKRRLTGALSLAPAAKASRPSAPRHKQTPS